MSDFKISNLFTALKEKKKIIFNSLWVITDKVARMFGGLIVGVWFARYVGPSSFGAWNYAYSIVALAIPFINLGLNNILLIDMIRNENKGKLVFTGIIIKLISGALISILLFLFSYFTLKNEQITRSLLIILSFQCLFQSSDVFDVFYQSRIESKNSVFAKTGAYILINILKVVALLNGLSILVFGVLTLLEAVIGSIILFIFYFKVTKQKISEWVFDKALAKNLLLRSWPLIISELLISFYTRLDQVMLKNMVNNAELGRYSAAVKLSEIWYFIAGAISVSIYPSIIKLKEKSEHEFLMGFQKLFNILTSISVIIALCFTFFSNFITNLLYGAKYPGIGSILSIHIWTAVFVFLGVGCGNWFIVNNLQRYIIIRTLSGAILNAGLNMILIPRYYGMGAAVATLISQMVASVLANAFSAKTRVIFKLQMKSFLVFFKPSIKNYI